MASVVSTLAAGTTAVIMVEAAVVEAVVAPAVDAAAVEARVVDAADRGGNCFGNRGNQILKKGGWMLSLFHFRSRRRFACCVECDNG